MMGSTARAGLWLLLAGCAIEFSDPEDVFSDGDPAAFEEVPFVAPAATVHRLTQKQYRNAVKDLLGVDFVGVLPGDLKVFGYATVGASEISVSPLDLEQYESAAWEVASAAW